MFGGRLGWPEIVLLVVIVLVVFGVGKLPSVGKALGQSIREFKASTKGEPKNDEKATEKKAKDVKAAATKDNQA